MVLHAVLKPSSALAPWKLPELHGNVSTEPLVIVSLRCIVSSLNAYKDQARHINAKSFAGGIVKIRPCRSHSEGGDVPYPDNDGLFLTFEAG